MKIRVAPQTGMPCPQFIIEAEDERDSILLDVFCHWPQYTKGRFELHLHGCTYQSCKGYDTPSSFNFGWMKIKKEKK